ncbi:MAG: hypothetical protein A2016_07855 [Elusimicrobia bacterium GWF2_62_30]|nr:MAG: hypothetical protein A2016_07855 [Elusimicrobia bacterium GWF2_62_30]
MTAILSSAPRSQAGLLAGNPRSLLAQADAVAGRFQDDGWGVACFGGRGSASVIKSPRAARLEKKAFTKAAQQAVSRVVVSHLRDASNPLGLPKGRLLRPENTQPFSADGLLFCHNGTLFIKDEIKSLLGKYAARVKGSNDSEVLFWQVVKMLDAYGSPQKALEMALDEIYTVWVSCKDRYPDREGPCRGLNMFLASPASLTVLCHYPLKNWKTALLAPGWEFGRVAWRREKGRVVFSSEPADGAAGWKKMSDLQVAHAGLSGGKISLTFSKIQRTFS